MSDQMQLTASSKPYRRDICITMGCEEPTAAGLGVCEKHRLETEEWLARPFSWDCGVCYTSGRYNDEQEAQRELVAHNLDNHFSKDKTLWPFYIEEMQRRLEDNE